MTLKKRLTIGVLAGLSVGIVRFLRAEFYLDASNKMIIGSLLTVVAFMILSTIHSWLQEEEKPMKLFMSSLVFPTTLITILSDAKIKPIESPELNSPSQIRSLSKINKREFIGSIVNLIPNSRAEEKVVSLDDRFEIIKLQKEDVEGAMMDGARSIIGNPQPIRTCLYVLGKTVDKNKAQTIVKSIQSLGVVQSEDIKLLTAEGKDEILITVGGLRSLQQAKELQHTLIEKALGKLDGLYNDPKRIQYINLLTSGVIVDARELIEQP